MPDIVIQKQISKENNAQKRKRMVEEGLPKKVSPLKKKNKIGDEKPEETDGEDWKSQKSQIINQVQQALAENRHLKEILHTHIHNSIGDTYVIGKKTETEINKTEKSQEKTV